MPGYTEKELRKKSEMPLWKRREVLQSPLIIFVIIGYAMYGIYYGIFWILKWLLFSWIAPFFNSHLFCKMGFHKYRNTDSDRRAKYYKCKICGKTTTIFDWTDF